ncbi:MAG TPA: thymidine phosphorylase, partial [Candidatus Diapherotrites archaeon]|nr:thymidine phosphorylase [Candidatus Diapherotrites archaeon]
IEHPLSLDPEGQVIASVLAKKASVGAEYVVIDLPIGPEVKIKSKERGVEMAKKFVVVGKAVGMKVEAVLTDGRAPSGPAFGPALEARHVLEILEGKAWNNLAEKSCEMAGTMLELVGKCKDGDGYKLAKEILVSGKALAKMKEIIRAQSGGTGITASKDVPAAKLVERICTDQDGEIATINVRSLINIARIAGAPADKLAGVWLHVSAESKVKKGGCLFEIHAENKEKLGLAVKIAKTSPLIELERSIIEKFE